MEILLRKIDHIIKEYKIIERSTGEKFNLFSILNVESNENRTHSAFLAELLNPKGIHKKGSLFLELFLNHCLSDCALI